jgi:hypothetical protein
VTLSAKALLPRERVPALEDRRDSREIRFFLRNFFLEELQPADALTRFNRLDNMAPF